MQVVDKLWGEGKTYKLIVPGAIIRGSLVDNNLVDHIVYASGSDVGKQIQRTISNLVTDELEASL